MLTTIDALEKIQSDLADVLNDLRTDEGVGEWMDVAYDEIGVRERAGADHNPVILGYLRSTSLGRWGASRDETPWCSAFVNWCMTHAGIEGTGSAMARSWLGWGLEIEDPRVGCIVILKRGAPPSGHVGFFVDSLTENINTFRMLGGNQSDSVCIQEYSFTDVLGYRWPETVSQG